MSARAGGTVMRDHFVAVEAKTDLGAHARALRQSWQAGVSGGGHAPHAVRLVIEQSWRRMAAAGLDVDNLHPRPAIDRDELPNARAASPLAEGLPVLRRCLCGIAHDAEHVMIVCDAAGRILWLEGKPEVKRSAARIALMEGMLWTEDSAGTNAIGIALAIEHPVQVFSAEHFLPEQHAWWCSAAPIHDPATGELLGVVNLSGPAHTAHPHSLALVAAAATMAEDLLRSKHAAEDDRLIQAYLERAAPARRQPTAVVGARGRVLAAQPAGWVPDTLQVPLEDGHVTLPAGRRAVTEPLNGGRGWLLWEVAQRPGRGSPRSTLQLELLGRHRRARVNDGRWLPLSLRHAEILALLALHPAGLTGEQLTLHLYGETGNTISTRAEMSRLRKLLGPCLAAKPYRLDAEVTADFLELERQLAAGEVGSALHDYDGSLLAESQVLLIEQVRNELDGALRRAATSGSLQRLWEWLQSEPGRDDAPALAHYLRHAPSGDRRRSLVAARLRALQIRWGRTPEAGTPA
jgi:hypothetical protein